MASEYQIDELGVAVAREHDVSGLQIPVHDPVLVSVLSPCAIPEASSSASVTGSGSRSMRSARARTTPVTALGLLDEIRRQDLQRYLAVELLVAGAVDDLQLAPTELFEHRVVRKDFPLIVSTQFPLIGTTVRARGCSVASGRGGRGPGEA